MSKIKLYDNKIIRLKNFETFEERLKYIQKKIFNKKKYNEYYNICNLKYRENSQKQKDIIKRWLGYKVVGKPEPQDHIKNILNYLGIYLLGAKDYSCNKAINRYIKLKNLKKEDIRLSKKQTEEYKELKNRIIFHKKKSKGKDIIFYLNLEMQQLLHKRLQELKEKKYKDYTEKFMIRNIENRLNICEDTITECINNNNKIAYNKQKINKLYDLLKKEYELMKESKDKTQIDYIERLCKQIKLLEEENNYLVKQNIKLRDDYYAATEYIYCNK